MSDSDIDNESHLESSEKNFEEEVEELTDEENELVDSDEEQPRVRIESDEATQSPPDQSLSIDLESDEKIEVEEFDFDSDIDGNQNFESLDSEEFDDEQDQPRKQLEETGENDETIGPPLLSHKDIEAYISVPDEVRKSKSFSESIGEEIKLAPQRVYRSHESFKDFLEFPTIAKNLKKMPKTGYFPKESVKPGSDTVFIADKIDITSQKGNKISVLVHRDHNKDIKALEILTKDGDRVLIALDTSLTEREKTTEYYPDSDSDPKEFTEEEIQGITPKRDVNDSVFKDFSSGFEEEDDFITLSKKLKDSDAISEDL